MANKSKIVKYQIIKTVVRRDGVRHTAWPGEFATTGPAMSKLAELDYKAKPWEHYSLRGVKAGESDNLEKYKPRIRDKRPVKLYAVKASPYALGKEPDGFVVPWYAVPGRDPQEAKNEFLHSAKARNAYHVHDVVPLTEEQEKKLLALSNEAARCKLTKQYAEKNGGKGYAE